MLANFTEVVEGGSRDEALLAQIDWTRLPRHVAVIMDGNGRWAAQRGQPRVAGHRAGVEAGRAAAACGPGRGGGRGGAGRGRGPPPPRGRPPPPPLLDGEREAAAARSRRLD